jgi:hypothetical protein
MRWGLMELRLKEEVLCIGMLGFPSDRIEH